MKRRLLKKQVNYIAGELFAECVVLTQVVPGIDEKKVDDLMTRILYMQDDFISRISHTQPGNVKGHYKKSHEDLNKEIQVASDELNTTA